MPEENQDQKKAEGNQNVNNQNQPANQENSDDKAKEFFSWPWIIATAAVVILVVAGFFYFRHRVNAPNEVSPEINQTSTVATTTAKLGLDSSQSTTTKGKSAFQKDVKNKSKSQPITQQIQIQEGNIVVSAAPGNGITHLARHALAEYLKQHPDLAKKLTKEHRVYIEDYLKDQIVKARHNQKVLSIGEKVSFSNNLIQQGIQQSQGLTQQQLDRLKTFSQRINWSEVQPI